MTDQQTGDPLTRVHERLDELLVKVGDIDKKVEVIAQRCVHCQESIKKHTEAIYGNGKEGIATRVATLESGKADTLSIKGVVTLLGAVGTLAGVIAGAIGAALAAAAK